MCGFAIDDILYRIQMLNQLNKTTMSKLDELIKNEVESRIETPFVTPNFGDKWPEYAQQMDKDTLIRIAWKNGRKAILLERLLRKFETDICGSEV